LGPKASGIIIIIECSSDLPPSVSSSKTLSNIPDIHSHRLDDGKGLDFVAEQKMTKASFAGVHFIDVSPQRVDFTVVGHAERKGWASRHDGMVLVPVSLMIRAVAL